MLLISYNRYKQYGGRAKNIFAGLLNLKNFGGENMEGCSAESCGCGSSRSFFTKEEKVEMLKEYKENLEKEAKGVAERIKQLQKNN